MIAFPYSAFALEDAHRCYLHSRRKYENALDAYALHIEAMDTLTYEAIVRLGKLLPDSQEYADLRAELDDATNAAYVTLKFLAFLLSLEAYDYLQHKQQYEELGGVA